MVTSCITIGLIAKLESVQKLFTRRLFVECKIDYMPYDQRLMFLSIDSLELRRLKYDLCMCYKILHGSVALNVNDFFMFLPRSHNFRSHNSQIFKCHSSHTGNHFYFANRVVSIWNSLRQYFIDCVNLYSFKICLSSHDFSNFVTGRS